MSLLKGITEAAEVGTYVGRVTPGVTLTCHAGHNWTCPTVYCVKLCGYLIRCLVVWLSSDRPRRAGRGWNRLSNPTEAYGRRSKTEKGLSLNSLLENGLTQDGINGRPFSPRPVPVACSI